MMAKKNRRSFTPQFKAEIVLAVLSGSQTMADICRQHGLKQELVYNWKRILLERLPTVFDGPTVDTQADRVAELERLIGQLTLELRVAKKASSMLPSNRINGGSSC